MPPPPRPSAPDPHGTLIRIAFISAEKATNCLLTHTTHTYAGTQGQVTAHACWESARIFHKLRIRHVKRKHTLEVEQSQ